MRVLFDFVANHTARDHEWFEDAYQNPDSPYRDRYEWQESGEPGTYFDWELIANLNHSNLEVRRFLLDVVDEWAPLVDGFRCDMAWAVPDSFWRELRDRVKDIDREFLLMDETIPYIPGFHEGMFDVHFDATLYFQLRQIGRGVDPAMSLFLAIDQRAEIGFPDHAEFLQYIENHDETRYRVECGDAAAPRGRGGAAIFTLPVPPMIYAGQEIGQRGRRDAIAWDHAREGVRDRYERLIAVREAHPALGPEGDLDRVGYHVASGDVSSDRSSPAATFTPTTWWRSVGATRTKSSSSSSSTSHPNPRASRSASTTPIGTSCRAIPAWLSTAMGPNEFASTTWRSPGSRGAEPVDQTIDDPFLESSWTQRLSRWGLQGTHATRSLQRRVLSRHLAPGETRYRRPRRRGEGVPPRFSATPTSATGRSARSGRQWAPPGSPRTNRPPRSPAILS